MAQTKNVIMEMLVQKMLFQGTSGPLAASSSVCLAIIQYHFSLLKCLIPNSKFNSKIHIDLDWGFKIS